jgi:DNA-binding PadR family transcriptional regulator
VSLRMAALGLLAQQPGSGYDLLKTFEKSMANVWPATQSQLYGELNKLADAGLIEVTDIGPRGRKEYGITPAGRAELQRWVMSPEDDPPFRTASLLRVFLLGEIEPDSRPLATPSTGPTARACSSAGRLSSTAFASAPWKATGRVGSPPNSTSGARSSPIQRLEVTEYRSCTARLRGPDRYTASPIGCGRALLRT